MIEDNVTGLLVPPRNPGLLAEALAKLIADGDSRQRLGRAGRERCEQRFSLAAHTRALLQEYERALTVAKDPQARCQPS
jgi:glycosyltransferase involved in cell wall biosynthesis